MATIIDGCEIANRIKNKLKDQLEELLPAGSVVPQLKILFFDTPASKVYKDAQIREANTLKIQATATGLPEDAKQDQAEEVIRKWNADPLVHGIFVHQPMPHQIDAQRISAIIAPEKDIEGIHPQNSARRFFAKARIGSCTALAVMELIESTGVALESREAVVVGHSEIVGRPVSMLLLDKLATTTVCHVATKNLPDHVKRADVLVVAVGKPHLIKGEWIKPGAVVIDVGINVVGGRVVGDVGFEAAKQRAAFISPVPGGVGPVTVMMVMKNTVEAFKLQQG